DALELLPHSFIEERTPRRSRLFEPQQAEIVSPALQQGEAHRLIVQRTREKGEILADELLLQVDGVRRDHRPFAVRGRPAQRRDEIAERLADTGACLEKADAALVV